MEQFLEALSKQFDDATIQKAQELLDDVLDIVTLILVYKLLKFVAH